MKLTQKKAVLVVVVLVIIACSFAVYLRLFTGKELWYEMFAAVLGVIITAVITMILLKGQSDDDVERERAAKIFEEKLRIYQDYLHTLCDVIRDHSLSDEEKIRLEFQTSYVAMHCESKYIATVSNAVKELIEYCCPDEENENLSRKNKSDSPDPLLDSLFRIVEAFRKDLYRDDFVFDKENEQKTLKNFSDAYSYAKSCDSNTEEKQRITVDLNVISNSLKNQIDNNVLSVLDNGLIGSEVEQDKTAFAADADLWEEALSRWKKEKWHIEGMTDRHDGFWMAKEDEDSVMIEVLFLSGKYVFRAQYKGDTDFSKPLTWEKGGNRRYGKWWRAFEKPFNDIPHGEFVKIFRSNVDLQQYVINNVEELKDIINRHHRTTTWKNELGSYENWNIFIWYWDMLACQLYSNGEKTFYMDIIEDGNSGNVLIQFANRKEDSEMLKNALKRIGCQDKEINSDGYVVLEIVPSTDAKIVAEKVKYWIEKING